MDSVEPENLDHLEGYQNKNMLEEEYGNSSALVVPAYNEEEIIEDTLEHLDEIELHFEEVYLVDDCSTDSTYSKIKRYLKENDTEVDVLYMEENGNKVGAIEKAVNSSDAENIVLTDADTRLATPEKIYDAEKHMDENGYAGMSLRIIPDDEADNLTDKIWNKVQDFEYGMSRALADYTTGDILRLDSDDKNVRCVPGAGGIYKKEVLKTALDDHSGKHDGDDIETTSHVQLKQGENIDYFDEVTFETNVPKSWRELKDQRQRWCRGMTQSFAEHPKEHVKEVFSGSRYGQLIALEAMAAGAAPFFAGKAALEASQGDLAQTAQTLENYVITQSGVTAGIGGYAAKQGEFRDNWSMIAGASMPFYRPASFIPAMVGSEKDVLIEKSSEAKESFHRGMKEGNKDLEIAKKLGRGYEDPLGELKGLLEREREEQEKLNDRDSSRKPAPAD